MRKIEITPEMRLEALHGVTAQVSHVPYEKNGRKLVNTNIHILQNGTCIAAAIKGGKYTVLDAIKEYRRNPATFKKPQPIQLETANVGSSD